jgi:hypothetical protein
VSAISNVRVVSDGHPAGTRIEVDGKPIDGVRGLKWEMKSHAHIGMLTLTIDGVEMDARALRVLIDGPDGDFA